ncbi:asparagine synthase (glutamine-hydrolyzing) [Sediminitomix flava]|uniref:asparagine synthase (glutamine-hydrolyzing) n=1 Tax=Sediminitomix flava TaxID=379075 RepID=A0A315ZDN5_SEDFL|nr:asparagine synthase (glutamine-hydrolyzing) [Sediminitomix flava]PWJ42968.1 asparagine synthase (glutamine-hydrolysing) [Sediminitomix flava]
MCGITGIFAFNELGRLHAIHLPEATNSLHHRGPDMGSTFTDYHVGLGHRRLSILDLSEGASQPMTDESGRYTIVFNGEIYNFNELKQELAGQGIQFKTTSDTEVLLYLYITEKEKCVERLNGFFAFAVYDKEEESLFIARDRFGIKPLLYFLDEDKLIFASEMATLLKYHIPKELDEESMYHYFCLSYIPAPHTIFKNIFKLEPGHYLEVKKGQVQKKAYYAIAEREEKKRAEMRGMSYEDAQKELLERLEKSVADRLISDVPIGAFLSGGIDSSAIVALASRQTEHLNTFSIGFKDQPMFDETKYAQMVADKYKTNHTAFSLTTDDLFTHLFELMDFFGEPFADASSIPFYILSQETRKHVTVALSGDGADEIFAGYNKYQAEYKMRENSLKARLLMNALPLLKPLPKSRHTYLTNKFRQLHKFSEAMHMLPAERYWYLCCWTSENQVDQLLSKSVRSRLEQSILGRRKSDFTSLVQGNAFNEVLLADMNLLLPNDMLQKADSMSMGNALEVRVPFLDHNVVEFAFGLPDHYKLNGSQKKRVLRDAVKPLLPPELYNRPKHGFEVPLKDAYKKQLRHWIEHEALNDGFIEEQGIFSVEYIRNVKNQIFHQKYFDHNQVWAILAFQYWWKGTFG